MKRLALRATLFVFLATVAQFVFITLLDAGNFERQRAAFLAELTTRGGIDAEALAAQYFPEPVFSDWVIFLGGSALIVVLFGVAWAWPITRRLRRIHAAARAVSEGDLSARTEATPGDAIDDVGVAFDEMADRVGHLIESQRHLLQAVSHELRTPIARMRFLIEAVADARDEPLRQKKLEAFDNEIEELDDLVAELLRFVRLDDMSAELAVSASVDLAAEVRGLVSRLKPPEGKAVQVSLHVDDDLPETRGHQRTIRHAVTNVLVNAARYCTSAVQVGLVRTGEGTSLIVDDDGPGISLAEREKLWQPFERLERGRERDKGGVGLGLAIVDRAMRRHGGSVAVDDSPLGGARFVLTWPAADAADAPAEVEHLPGTSGTPPAWSSSVPGPAHVDA